MKANEISKCTCGSGKPSIWYQFSNGRQLVTIKCNQCGKASKAYKTEKRALKNWEAILKGR